MKVAFKSLIAAAAFITAAGAGAATVTVTAGSTVYKGAKITGGSVLSLAPDTRAVLDILVADVTATNGSQVAVVRDADNMFQEVTVASPIASLQVDDSTDTAVSLASPGGMTVTVPVIRSVSSGGSLSITDLNIDLASKKVFATVVGANGVGTVTNVALWDIDTVLGSTTVGSPWGGTTVSEMKVSGLHLTADGVSKVVSALGLGSLGKAAVQGISDFGSISLTMTAQPATDTPPCSVSFKTTNQKAVLFNTEVTVNNLASNPATGWTVNWRYNKPTLLIAPKNAKLSDKGLKEYTAKPVGSNATINADASTTFSFKGHANDGAPVLSGLSASLGGQACEVVVAQ